MKRHAHATNSLSVIRGVNIPFCAQHPCPRFLVGGRWEAFLPQFQHVIHPQPSLHLTLNICRPASGPLYLSTQPERLRRRPPTTRCVLHQGRAAAHEADGKAERDGELHRDGEGDGRSSQLPSFQGAADQGEQEGASMVLPVRTRAKYFLAVCAPRSRRELTTPCSRRRDVCVYSAHRCSLCFCGSARK